MKKENSKARALLLCAVVVAACISIIPSTFAISSNPSTTAAADASAGSKYNEPEKSSLGNPFYVEHYRDVVEKPEILNKGSSGNFTGKGILNGTLNINAQGNSTETFRNNNTVSIQGNAKFMTDNKDEALYSFEAIGIYNSDGTFECRGAAVFADGATGELSSLSNIVAIYKDHVDNSGNGTFLMWRWE